MFTGIIEEVGKVTQMLHSAGSAHFTVECRLITESMKKGDSVSVNGVCQTITEFSHSSISFTSVEETLKKTSLGMLRMGSFVNLERALTPVSRMGGHFVLGHIDCTGSVKSIKKLQGSVLLTVAYPEEFDKFVVASGSVTINGISLTIASAADNSLTVSVIPFTGSETTILNMQPEDSVNLEFDILAKYLLKAYFLKDGKQSKISLQWLQGLGY